MFTIDPRRFDPSCVTTVIATIAVALTACAGPGSLPPAAQRIAPQALGLDGGTIAPELADRWWSAFGDADLDALVAKALQDHPSLRVAAARLQRVRALAERLDAQRLPQVDARMDLLHQRFPEHGLFPPSVAGQVKDTGSLQTTFAWELDFFGRNRAAFEAGLSAERAAQADEQAARLLLASTVVRTYVQLAQLVAQRAIAERALAQRSQVLALIRRRVQVGLDTNVELRQGEAALPEIRQTLEALDEQIVLHRHALAALAVQAAENLEQLRPTIESLRDVALPTELPADLLGRRPDVDAARWRIEAATSDLRAARAEFYPSVNLLGFAGFNAIGLGNVLDSGSRYTGVGPALRLPLFDAGRLRANYRGKAADLDASIALYNAAVIEAVREVSDRIATVRSVARQQIEQSLANDAAEGAYDLAEARYAKGVASYLTVLSAESAVLAQRRVAVDLKARTLVAKADLMRALGGGYVAGPEQ